MLNPSLFNVARATYFAATLLSALHLGLPQSRRTAFAATGTMLAGFLVNTGAFTVHWIETHKLGFGYVPLSNIYESMVFFAWCIALVYLLWNGSFKPEN